MVMNDRTQTVSPVALRLESIQRRMAGVSEEETLAALLESLDSESGATVLTLTYVSAEPEARSGFAWTQTA